MVAFPIATFFAFYDFLLLGEKVVVCALQTEYCEVDEGTTAVDYCMLTYIDQEEGKFVRTFGGRYCSQEQIDRDQLSFSTAVANQRMGCLVSGKSRCRSGWWPLSGWSL